VSIEMAINDVTGGMQHVSDILREFLGHNFVSGLRTLKPKQDAQLSQKDRAAGCVIVMAKSGRLELGDNILQTLYLSSTTVI